MGLDMYLSAKCRAYASDWSPAEEKALHAKLDAASVIPKLSNNLDYIEIEREAAYWRKANQIHNWFVTHVQNGTDDCGHYYVSREQLKELRDTCYKVLQGSVLVPGNINVGQSYTPDKGWENMIEAGQVVLNRKLAEELLPTAGGFFFGSTDYDQYYIDDLKLTIEQLDKCLALPEHIEFEYHSSW